MIYSLALRHIGSRLLDILFPPQCLSCNALLAKHGTLCAACWPNIRFITEPYCVRCGFPFEYTLGEGALCGNCIHVTPPYAQARACFRYDESSRALILPFKYADRTHLATVFTPWLLRAGVEMIEQCDVIVPVPLHKSRMIRRRYNQAALLAQALAKCAGRTACLDMLLRTRVTKPQSGLTRTQRQENVKGAFSANPKRSEKIEGKTILLVDDVMTTGTTLVHCTNILLKAGAKEVYILTLARRV